MATGEFFDHSPPPAVERLARIEGQSNFLSMLAGIEVGPDTTIDMGALSFARSRGCVPEVLEANVAQSSLFKLPLMSMVWHAVLGEFSPKEKDWPWIQGAIADAFLLMRGGQCKGLKLRARRFKVDHDAYAAMRKIAAGVFAEMLGKAEADFKKSRTPRTPDPANLYNEVTSSTFVGRASAGHYTQPSLTPSAPINDSHIASVDTHGVGMNDRLGWDERNDVPGPITNPLESSGASTVDDGEGEP